MHSFFEIIRTAYELGDLSDQMTLRQAMMFENHSNCPDDVKTALAIIREWPELNSLEPSPAWKASPTPFSESVPKGNTWMPATNLHRVVRSTLFLKNVTITQNSEDILGNPDRPATDRVAEFEEQVKPYLNINHHKGFLFVHSGPILDPLTHLVQDLGLFHYGIVDENVSLLRFTFKPAECRKPHWVDADLAFYFRQTDDSIGHGWTLSLQTGTPCYPELVHNDVFQLELIDVLLQKMDGFCDLENPPEEYWEVQRQRILEGRI